MRLPPEWWGLFFYWLFLNFGIKFLFLAKFDKEDFNLVKFDRIKFSISRFLENIFKICQ